MLARFETDRRWQWTFALPFVVVGFFWGMLALSGVLDPIDGAADAVLAVALWGAVGFVAFLVVSRILMVATLALGLVFRVLRTSGRRPGEYD